ncbi:hypothetical protein Hanom_Chr17g01530241 [Helianthus anomalus]
MICGCCQCCYIDRSDRIGGWVEEKSKLGTGYSKKWREDRDKLQVNIGDSVPTIHIRYLCSWFEK